MAPQEASLPKTIEEAAIAIVEKMSTADKSSIRATTREDLIHFHHRLGAGIRNELGLWRNNQALLESGGCSDPDDCSMKIIERVWEKLQASEPGVGEPSEPNGRCNGRRRMRIVPK